MKAWADVITLTYLATDEKSNRNSSLLIPFYRTTALKTEWWDRWWCKTALQHIILIYIYLYILMCSSHSSPITYNDVIRNHSRMQIYSPWPPWSGLWARSMTAGRRRPCYNRIALTHLLCWSSWGPAGTGSWWGSTAGQKELPWWKTPSVSGHRHRKTCSTPCVHDQNEYC